MSEKYKAIVLGATGLVGQALVRELQDDKRYDSISCLVRTCPQESGKAPHVNYVETDFDALQQSAAYFSADHVYVCLGTTIKKARTREAFRKVDYDYVLQAAKLAGLQRCTSFVWISSVGANARSGNFYLRVKGELEAAIFAIPQLEHAFSVQPSLLLGERSESRFAEQIGIAVAKMFSPLFIGPIAKYRPIEAEEVARQMIGKQVF